MPSASKGYFGIAEEASAGVAETTPDALLPVQSVDFPLENEFIDVYEIRGSRQAYGVQDGPVRGTASISGAVYPSGGMARLFKGLLGDVSSALISPSTVAYEHAFSDAASLPYFTLERSDAFSGEGNVLSERLAGSKVESMSFNCAYGEQVDFSANFQAIKRPAKTGSPLARGAVAFPTQKILRFDGAAISVNGAPNSLFKNLSIEITNTLERQETLNETNEAYKIFEGGIQATLSGSAVFEDMALYDLLVDGTEFEVEVDITNKVYADQTNSIFEGVRFVFPAVRLASHGAPMNANEVINADLQFRVLYDDASTSSCQIYMTNTEDGTLY